MARLCCRILSCVLLSMMCLAGCSWKEAPVQEGMHVEVNFSDVHRCSRISPEILVYNPPRGTVYYDVRVSVVGTSPERYLGGGRWGYGGLNSDGADVIPEGGLLNTYRAPCVSGGMSSDRTFRFTVYAMSRESTTPLAISDYTLTLDE